MDSEKIYLELMKNYSKKYLRKFLNEEYYFLSMEEIDKIIKIFNEVSEDNFNSIESTGLIEDILESKKIIKSLIEEEDLSNVDMEGYLLFRMKNFISYIETTVDIISELFYSGENFDEIEEVYLEILRNIYLTSEPVVNKMIIKMTSSESCDITDGDGCNIENLIKKEIDKMGTLMNDSATYSDTLMGAMLNIAPKEIVIINPHLCDDIFLIEAAYVFRERLIIIEKV